MLGLGIEESKTSGQNKWQALPLQYSNSRTMQQAVSSKFAQGTNEGGQAPMMYPIEMVNDAQKQHGNSQMDLTA